MSTSLLVTMIWDILTMLFTKSFLINKCVKLLNLPPHISTDVGSQLVSHISDCRGWLCLQSMEGTTPTLNSNALSLHTTMKFHLMTTKHVLNGSTRHI